MPEPFRSLASILSQPEDEAPHIQGPRTDLPETTGERDRTSQPLADERIVDLLDTFIGELARLRARAAERFEEQAEAVLAGLARRVLARELALEPPHIDALLAEALRELDGSTGLVVHVCPSDAERLGTRWPVAAKAGLAPGDFAVEVDDGRYDVLLQTRLEALLATQRFAL